MSEIEDGTFEGAASVSELHLTANQLESIRSGMFRGLDGERKEPGRRPRVPIAYSPLTSLPRIPLACFTVAFRQKTGFWSDRRWGLSPRGSWPSQPP